MSFIDLFIKKEETAEIKSLHNAYRIMNYLRDAYIKKEKAYELGCSNTTLKYFEDRLDAIVKLRQDTYNQFLYNCNTATAKNTKLIESAKTMFFEEFKKQYPSAEFSDINDLIDFNDDMNCKFKPLDDRIVNLFSAMVSGEKTEFSKFESMYIQLMNLYNQEQTYQQYYDLIKAVFNQTNPYGRDMNKDNYWGVTNTDKLPKVYSVADNTYFISTEIIDNLTILVNVMYKQQSKLDASQTKYIAYLEKKLAKAKTEDKALDIQSALIEAKEDRSNTLIWLSTASNLKNVLDAINERKVGLNDMLDDTQLKLNHIMNTALLYLFTTDKIGQINGSADTMREHLIVHSKEVDALLQNGKLMFATVIPCMELAKYTGKTITIEKDMADYGADVLAHIYNRNVEKIQSAIDRIAKAENTTAEDKIANMPFNELISLGFDTKMLSTIRFETPNGTFAYTGDAIYHFETNQKISVEALENIPKLFGIEQEKTIEDRLLEIESAVSSVNKQGLTEEEYENKVIEAISGGGNTTDTNELL